MSRNDWPKMLLLILVMVATARYCYWWFERQKQAQDDVAEIRRLLEAAE